MYKEEFPVWALRKGRKIFVDFSDSGPQTIPDKDVSCMGDFYSFGDHFRAKFFLDEYEARLKGFSVCVLRVVKTFEIMEITPEEAKKLDKEWIKNRLGKK